MSNYSFPEFDFARCGSFKDASDALRKLIETMNSFTPPIVVPDLNFTMDFEEKNRSHLSDDEWENIMKNIGGK